jgi:hypothetical protein
MELSGDLEVAVVDHVCKRETRRTQNRDPTTYRNSQTTKMMLLLLSLSKISRSLCPRVPGVPEPLLLLRLPN